MLQARVTVARGTAVAWLLLCSFGCESAPARAPAGGEAGAAGDVVGTSAQALEASPAGQVSYEYDATRRLRRVVYAGGAERRYTLDAAGNRVKVETDMRPGKLSFEPQGYRTSFVEGEEFVILVARRDGRSGPAAVDCVGVGRSATAGVDFGILTPRLTWSDGDNNFKSCVAVVNFNPEFEEHEQFELQLQNASAAMIGSPSSVLIDVDDLRRPDGTPPTVPTGVTATLTSETSVRVTWQPSTDPNVPPELSSSMEGYRVYRNGVQVGTVYVPIGTLEYVDNGLALGTTYRYTIAAFDGVGNASAQSAAATVSTPTPGPDTTPPTVPAGVTATLTSNSSARVTWQASTDPILPGQRSSSLEGYRVYRSGVLVGTVYVPIAVLELLDSGLQPATTYYYVVFAFDADGNVSGNSAAASVTTPGVVPATDTTPPTPPPFVNATALSTSSVKVSWGTSTDPVVAGHETTGVYAYIVQRDGATIAEVQAPGQELIDNGLAANTRYRYVVYAYDLRENVSTPAGPAEVVTSQPQPQPPAAPAFTGMAAGCPTPDGYDCPYTGALPLTWTAVFDATRYQLEQSIPQFDGSTFVPGPYVLLGETISPAFTVPESQRSIFTERYRVRACNSECGPYSPTTNFFTPFSFPEF